jgi:hypothetical protein
MSIAVLGTEMINYGLIEVLSVDGKTTSLPL